MQAHTDNLNEPKPKRLLGWRSATVGSLLVVVICFTNALCHPSARLMREVKQIKRGEPQEAVVARMKTLNFMAMSESYAIDASTPRKDDRCLVIIHPPNWWHFFCPGFPFIEQLRQSKSGLSKATYQPPIAAVVYFEDGKAVRFSIDGGLTILPL